MNVASNTAVFDLGSFYRAALKAHHAAREAAYPRRVTRLRIRREDLERVRDACRADERIRRDRNRRRLLNLGIRDPEGYDPRPPVEEMYPPSPAQGVGGWLFGVELVIDPERERMPEPAAEGFRDWFLRGVSDE